MIEKIFSRIRLEISCLLVDYTPLRILCFTSCFEIFPPSFYLRHKEKEAEKIKGEVIEELYDWLDRL